MDDLVLRIRPPLAREDLPGLFDRVCGLLDGAGAVVVCVVGGVAADAVAIDALARLQLAARRRHCRIHLCGATAELVALIALSGLDRVLPVA
jgi:ABC-type transporter Mla MlaB component